MFQAQTLEQPIVIAGPCVAESAAMLDEVSGFLAPLAAELGFQLVFKASFDKANRTSIDSYRGPGAAQLLQWFGDIKERHQVPVLTDVHEVAQIPQVAEVCDVLQIPAFLCRQTDLLAAAVRSGRAVNVKKGQFLAPENAAHIVNKAREVARETGQEPNVALTERGVSFGYGRLVVDMTAFAVMAENQVPLIFDITHSTQMPASGATTAGARPFAPTLARAATATGHLSGFFLEVHPDPHNAKSDSATQLSMKQADALLRQLIPQWRASSDVTELDVLFKE